MLSFQTTIVYFLTLILIKTNLIRHGDFENFVLAISQAPYYPGMYLMTNYYNSYSWYSNPNVSVDFQILNYMGAVKQGLDTLYGDNDRMACQDVSLQINKAYKIQFQYIVDSNSPKKFNAFFNDEMIHSEDVPQYTVNLFSGVFIATQTNGTLCFQGVYVSSRSSSKRGVIIDNVYIDKATVTQNIIFQATEDWSAKKLIISSDFIVDPSQMMIFNNTIVKIGAVNSPILNISLGIFNNMELTTNLDIELNQFSSKIVIILPDYQYVDNNGYSVKFIIMNTSDLYLQPEILQQPSSLPEIQPYIQQEIIRQRQALVDFFAYFLVAVNTLRLIGFTALVFRFVSFANIYILYIFLDIGYLDSQVRIALQKFSDILLGRGLISSFWKLVLGSQIDLTLFKIQTAKKIPDIYDTKGSSLHVINISINLFDCCFEDFVVIIVNCLLILILWFIISKMIKYKLLQKFINKYMKPRILKNALLIEVISVAPSWTLSISITLTPICVFASQDFYTKINQSIFLSFPLLMVLLWVPIQIRLFYKQNIQAFNMTMKYIMQNLLDSSKKTQIERKLGSKYNYLQKQLARIQTLNDLFFVIFGFLIGFQNTYLFFMLVTLYKIIKIVLILKISEKGCEYFVTIIENFIKLTIHISFLALFIITKLIEFNVFGNDQVQEKTYIISIIIFYSYLCGIGFQILILIVKIVAFLVSLIKNIGKNSTKQQSQSRISENKGFLRSNQIHDNHKQDIDLENSIKFQMHKKLDNKFQAIATVLTEQNNEDNRHVQKIYKMIKTEYIGEGNFKILFSVSDEKEIPQKSCNQ